jgi:hypothetical protein
MLRMNGQKENSCPCGPSMFPLASSNDVDLLQLFLGPYPANVRAFRFLYRIRIFIIICLNLKEFKN